PTKKPLPGRERHPPPDGFSINLNFMDKWVYLMGEHAMAKRQCRIGSVAKQALYPYRINHAGLGSKFKRVPHIATAVLDEFHPVCLPTAYRYKTSNFFECHIMDKQGSVGIGLDLEIQRGCI